MSLCVACKKPEARCDCFVPQYRFIPEYRKNNPGRPVNEGKPARRPINLLKKHGLTGYTTYKCRCEKCRGDWIIYQRASYQKKKAKRHAEKAS